MTKRTSAYSPEVRERAVRMVLDHRSEHGSQWAAIQSIASKIGCSGETLRSWVRQSERDDGLRAGPTCDEREELAKFRREVRELRQANEILRKASAYFAQAELDRRFKPLRSDNQGENSATNKMRMPRVPVSKGGRSPTEAPAHAVARSW